MLCHISSFCFCIRIFIFFCLLFSVHGRHAKKHKHSHHHDHYSISQPPSPPPSPSSGLASPPDDGGYSSSLNSSGGIFDVRHFGAIGDGMVDDTEAFKMAWDTACQSDDDDSSAVILVPYGFSFLIQSTIFTGPCKKGVVFHIDGTLVAPDGPDAWPRSYSAHQWLVFYRVYNMSLQGDGLIDGRGQKWWDLPCKPHKGGTGKTTTGRCDSPIAIRFFMSSNLTVEGLRIRDSPQFHFRFDNCRDVYIDSLQITAPAFSPNTDGIHIENTNGVKIYNSIVANGLYSVIFLIVCFLFNKWTVLAVRSSVGQ